MDKNKQTNKKHLRSRSDEKEKEKLKVKYWEKKQHKKHTHTPNLEVIWWKKWRKNTSGTEEKEKLCKQIIWKKKEKKKGNSTSSQYGAWNPIVHISLKIKQPRFAGFAHRQWALLTAQQSTGLCDKPPGVFIIHATSSGVKPSTSQVTEGHAAAIQFSL